MTNYSKYIISADKTVRDALVALNNLSLSDDVLTLFVINDNKQLIGTLTDGDIRRKLVTGILLDDYITNVINTDFHAIYCNKIEISYIKILKKKGITLLPSLNEKNEIVNIYNFKKLHSILPIDAILMAGGKGERLRPLTEKTPKPLLPIGNKPIIDYNIDRLINYGVSSINVTVNYLKEQIQEHFSHPINDVLINCVQEPCYLGTMGSVNFVKNIYNDYVLVMNSDLFTNIDYEDFFVHFREHDADMSVAAVPYTVSIPYGIFDLEGRNIQGVKEKPSYNYYANAGIYLLKKEIIDLIPDNKFFNATDLIELLINKGYKVIRFPLTGYWIDIGKPEDYKKAQELVKHL